MPAGRDLDPSRQRSPAGQSRRRLQEGRWPEVTESSSNCECEQWRRARTAQNSEREPGTGAAAGTGVECRQREHVALLGSGPAPHKRIGRRPDMEAGSALRVDDGHRPARVPSEDRIRAALAGGTEVKPPVRGGNGCQQASRARGHQPSAACWVGPSRSNQSGGAAAPPGTCATTPCGWKRASTVRFGSACAVGANLRDTAEPVAGECRDVLGARDAFPASWRQVYGVDHGAWARKIGLC